MGKSVYLAYWFVLLFAPLALGASSAWSRTVVEGLCFVLLLLIVIHCRRSGEGLYRAPGMRPLLLLLLLPLVQLVPLPALLLRLLSPTSAEIYRETIWVARPDVWMPISLAPKATLAEFFRFASYGAFYLVTLQLLDSRERLKETTSLVCGFAALFSLLGIVLFVFSGGRILWYLGDWSGTLPGAGANRDHFAGFAGMILPLMLGFFLAIRPQVNYMALRETIEDFLRHPRSHPHLLLSIAMLLLIVALLLSGSAIGLVSSLGSLLVFLLLLLVRGSRHKKRLWGALVAVAVIFSAVFFSWGLVWTDQESHETAGGRIVWETETVWLDTLNIFGDFPVAGAGAGAFETVYPRYKTVRTADVAITHAGNDYLEHLAEAGIIGTLLLAWFLLSVLRHAFPAWRRRHNRVAVYLFLGALAGLAGVLLHSFSDFVRSIGAFGLYGFFLAALAVAAAHTHSRGEGFTGLGSRAPGNLALSSAAVLLGINLLFNAGLLLAHNRHAEIVAIEAGGEVSDEARERVAGLAAQAISLDPLSARYRYVAGDSSLAGGDVDVAFEHFLAALRRDPMDSEYLQRIGLVLENLGKPERAEQLLRAGVLNDPTSSERHKDLAFWLLDKGKRREGLEHIREAIYWDPERTGDFIAIMSLYGVGDEEMRRVLPQSALPLLVYGEYLSSVGKWEAAEESYREAVEAASRERQASPVPFERISEYYTRNEDFNDALEVVQAGIEQFPENAEFRVMAGLLYEELGISYRAIEEYRRALILNPGSVEARQRLEELAGSLH